MSRKLTLTRGRKTSLDEEDYFRFRDFKWHTVGKGKYLYAGRNRKQSDGIRERVIYLHREIMDALSTHEVDHINGNRLDNRKKNLRVCTHRQNLFNTTWPNHSSKFRGVTFNTINKNWNVRLKSNGKNLYLGSFNSEIQAAKTYDSVAIKYRGEFAKLNFPKRQRKPLPDLERA